MTWDIFVQDLPSGLTHAREVPRTFRPTPLGKRDELIEKITAFEPAVDFSDPSWGHLQQSSFLVEFNLGRQPVVAVTVEDQTNQRIRTFDLSGGGADGTVSLDGGFAALTAWPTYACRIDLRLEPHSRVRVSLLYLEIEFQYSPLVLLDLREGDNTINLHWPGPPAPEAFKARLLLE